MFAAGESFGEVEKLRSFADDSDLSKGLTKASKIGINADDDLGVCREVWVLGLNASQNCLVQHLSSFSASGITIPNGFILKLYTSKMN